MLSPEDAVHAWPTIRPILARAVDRVRGRTSCDHILECVQIRTMQLWLLVEPPFEQKDVLAVVVTELREYPGRSVCVMLLAAGRLVRRWKPLLGVVEEWAKLEGAELLEIHGRRGWGGLLPEFEEDYTVFVKEIGP